MYIQRIFNRITERNNMQNSVTIGNPKKKKKKKTAEGTETSVKDPCK